MKATRTSPYLRLLLWLLLVISLLAGCARSEQWIDEAVLHDGRTIDVHRTVIFNFGSGDLSQALRRWPNQFALEAVNPYTGKRVKWSGERNINPILLDFIDGVPYLVVTSNFIHRHGSLYGCPEIPFAFLRYDDKAVRWAPIAQGEAPKVLRRANLSPDYRTDWAEMGSTRQSKEDIDSTNRGAEMSSTGFFNATIPENFQAWTYVSKKRFANTRYHDDCRPPVPEPVDIMGPRSPAPPSTAIALEILESKSYDQASAMQPAEALRLTWSPERAALCGTHLGPADKNDPRLDSFEAFIKNPTRVTANIRPRICDIDAVWIIDYVIEQDRTVLVKANAAGDVLYRISFEKPAGSNSYGSGIAQASFRTERGYLYFEWWNSSGSGMDSRVSSVLKVRIQEPVR
jgi:hypothetical protein